MPHFGLMDPSHLGREAACLQRARLHIRAGRRRLRQGKIAAGVVTLWDAVAHAMEWYVLGPERRARMTVEPGENLNEEAHLFRVLRRSGVVDGSFKYEDFAAPFERALGEGDRGTMTGFNDALFLGQVEAFMFQLGVMPFSEGELPPEDPATF